MYANDHTALAQMHRCMALLPCLHSMCAGCAAQVLDKEERCPSCRIPVEGAKLNLVMRGLIEAVCAADPSRKRKVPPPLPWSEHFARFGLP